MADAREAVMDAAEPSRESRAMLLAVAAARAGLGATSPNPSVGAVVLDRAGEVAGIGATEPTGGRHAEVTALAGAGERARGGTAVVTLEPCNHTGRTGPCTRALINAGIARVVIAVRDPNPVAAGGVEALRAAGVEVVLGVQEAEARHGLRYWLASVQHGRPYLIWKYAATLDGRSAAADGTSQWITSEQSRADVHELRGTIDAIIAGVGTILADDAHLTVRRPDGASRPLRVVVDSHGRTPENARVRDSAAPTWVATALELGAAADGRVDLVALMAALDKRGVRGALLEGGPTLAGAFLAAGLVDEVVGYVAPKLLGAGPAALGDAGVTGIGGAVGLDLVDITRLGPDLRLTAVPREVT
jgi:diaminohydroxyphosphoribosylaminopyrimidine deaminase/5-amino-6-(5-phosphoribosylamino)uracil reductase